MPFQRIMGKNLNFYFSGSTSISGIDLFSILFQIESSITFMAQSKGCPFSLWVTVGFSKTMFPHAWCIP